MTYKTKKEDKYKNISDLIEISKFKNANVSLLIKDAYKRGLKDGKDLAKIKMIEAIIEEK